MKHLAQLVRECGANLASRCKDDSIKDMTCCFPRKTPALSFDGVTANYIDEFCSRISRGCDGILEPYLATVESNIIQVYELAQSPNAKEEIRKSFLELMSAYSRKTAMSRDFVSKKINSYCVQAGGFQPSDAIGDEEKPTVHIDLSSETAKQAKAEVSGGQTDRWQSSTHIALWLESLGLHQYITSFQQCKIDSVGMLLKITNDDLLDLRVEARHRLANKTPKMHHASARASFSCLESLNLPDFPHPPFRDGPDSKSLIRRAGKLFSLKWRF